MKRGVLVLVLILIAGAACSQGLRVESIVELTQDLTARTSPRLDKSGTECALLRINIPSIREVYFSSPIVGDPIYSPGEYTVYVPANSKRVDLTCEGKPLSIVFSDFQVALQPKSCYRVVVKKFGNNASAEGYARVKITANYEDDILLIDGVPVGQLPLYLDDITVGEHTFSVPNTLGRVCKDSIINISLTTATVQLFLKEEEKHLVMLTIDDGGGLDMNLFEPRWDGLHTEVRNSKMGVVDYAGNIIVPFRYDNVEIGRKYKWITINGYEKEVPFPNGLFFVEKKENDIVYAGIYKPDYGEVLPCIYRRIYGLGYGICAISKGNNKWQLFNLETGHFVRSDYYSKVRCELSLNHNAFITAEDETQNYIVMDTNCTHLLIIPYSSNTHTTFYPYWGFAVSNSQYIGTRVFDLEGHTYQMPSNYKFVSVSDGLLAVYDKYKQKYGFLNYDMSEIIPVRFNSWWGRVRKEDLSGYALSSIEELLRFEHGFIVLSTDSGDIIIYNNKGKVIAQTNSSYKHIYADLYDNNIVCENAYEERCMLDEDGNVIIPFTKNLSAKGYLKDENGQSIGYGRCWKYYSSMMNDPRIPIHCRYFARERGYTFALSEDYFTMYVGNNMSNIVKIPVSSEADEMFFKDYQFPTGYGNFTIEATYDNRLFRIINRSSNKYGYISPTGELLTSCIYDNLSDIVDVGDEELGSDAQILGKINEWSASEGYGIISIGGLFGYIDVTGKVVVPLIYTAVTPFIDGVAWVRDQNGKWKKIHLKDLK